MESDLRAQLAAEVARREQAEADIATLRSAISADHATDPTWSVAQIATLAQAHRSDSETADQAHIEDPNNTYDSPIDWEAVSRDRQVRIQQAERERDEALIQVEAEKFRAPDLRTEIAAFVARVNARAEADMLAGNPITGAHHRAIDAELAALTAHETPATSATPSCGA